MLSLLILPLATAFAAAAVSPASVYEVKPARDLSITLLSGGGALAVYAFGNGLIAKRCPCDPREVNAFDRQAIGNHSGAAEWFSDAAVGAAIVGPVAADLFDVGAGPVFTEDMEVLAQTLAVNGAMVTAAKYSVQRPLPRTYAGDPAFVGSARGYRSFYSGHASTAAAALTAAAQTARLRHHAGWAPWLLAVGAAMGIGLERVAAGKHFYSDVAAGVFMGSAVGTAVPWLHERGGPDARVSVAAQPGGAAVRFSLRF